MMTKREWTGNVMEEKEMETAKPYDMSGYCYKYKNTKDEDKSKKECKN